MARGQKRSARKKCTPPKNFDTRRRSKSSEPLTSSSHEPIAPTTPAADILSLNTAQENMISPRTELIKEMQRTFSLAENTDITPDQQQSSKKLKTDPDMDVDDVELINGFLQLESGQILTVGMGSTGQLGLGPDIMERKKPYPVKSLQDKKFKIISCGAMHTACISENFEIYTWGCNDEGALGRKCKDDEEETLPQQVHLPEGSGRPIDVTCGDSHTAILDEFGQVYVWGNFRDGSGVLGLVDAKTKSIMPVKMNLQDPVMKISSGADHLLLLTKFGVAFTFGSGGVGQLGRGGRYFSDRGGRRGTSFVLKPAPVRFAATRKSRATTSMSEDRELTQNIAESRNCQFTNTTVSKVNTPRHNAKHVENIFACGLNSFIISREQVYSFGLNNYKQLGLKDGENRFAPTYSPEFSENTWIQIEGGEHHVIALDFEHNVYGIGRGDYGRLGIVDPEKDNQSIEQTSTLQKLNLPNTSDRHCVAISSYGPVGYCRMSDGSGYSWGFGESLQLTTGDDEDVLLPTPIQGGRLEGKRILSCQCGGQHGAFIVST